VANGEFTPPGEVENQRKIGHNSLTLLRLLIIAQPSPDAVYGLGVGLQLSKLPSKIFAVNWAAVRKYFLYNIAFQKT
jgi:hypothetical protein